MDTLQLKLGKTGGAQTYMKRECVNPQGDCATLFTWQVGAAWANNICLRFSSLIRGEADSIKKLSDGPPGALAAVSSKQSIDSSQPQSYKKIHERDCGPGPTSETYTHYFENIHSLVKQTKPTDSKTSSGRAFERDPYYTGLSTTYLPKRKNLNRSFGVLEFVSTSSFILLIALCLNDASPCHSSGLVEQSNISSDYNYANEYLSNPSVKSHDRYLNSDIWSPWSNRRRQLNNDPLGTMSSVIGSFTLDQSNNQQLPGSQSWTSLLNPFSGNNSGGQLGATNDMLDRHIRNILVPRVSGTQGNIRVRNYIVDVLNRNNYYTELDEFDSSTPVGNVRFANIIASSNPKACRQLVLACHYDSKMMNGFLGATDSAVPCAMLLNIAETLNRSYRPKNDESAADALGLRFIFFDGEEAFVQWTHTDSLYGSRHLAAKWAKEQAPQECNKSPKSQKRTELDRIELFVLLDLIGTSDTTFVQYSSSVRRHYEALQRYEKDHIAKTKPNLTQSQIRRDLAFKSRSLGLDLVEDDHVPFKQRGVPILLLLANPFPSVWHTVSDNYEAIDFPRTRRVLYALEEFVANYSS